MKTNFQKVVDRLGFLNAQKKIIEAEADVLKKQIIESGKDTLHGKNFFAIVVERLDGRLDIAAVREKLSPQFIAAHTIEKKVVSVVVKANEIEVPVVKSDRKVA